VMFEKKKKGTVVMFEGQQFQRRKRERNINEELGFLHS